MSFHFVAIVRYCKGNSYAYVSMSWCLTLSSWLVELFGNVYNICGIKLHHFFTKHSQTPDNQFEDLITHKRVFKRVFKRSET